MKIAVIGQKGIPSRVGGVEIHVEEISRRLVEKGHNVTAYCRRTYCKELHKEYEGITLKYIFSFNTKHLDAITYTILATIDVIKGNYDIIHYHALGPSLLAFLPRVFGKKVVCTIHGLDWKREKWGNFAKFVLKIGERASIIFPNKTIAVSESLANYCINKYKKDVVYIPNGVEEKRKEPVEIIKRKYNVEEDEFILYLARLVPEKGAHYLIEAFKKIETEKRLIIAGGSSHSDDYVNKLRLLAKDDKRIKFTGFVNGKELDELFTNAYIYVLPSEIEGLPISLLEAMAYGQCCLVSDIEENKEVISEHGFTFKNKDVSDLRQKIEELLEHKDQVRRINENAEVYIKEKYNWDLVANQTEKEMLKILEK